MEQKKYLNDAVQLLQALIATPRVSRDEASAADLMQERMKQWGLSPQREANNLWVVKEPIDQYKQTILLNAHIDTVKPVKTWTRDPHEPAIEDGRLYGLGSNDCGGGLVSLLQVFRILKTCDLPFNLVYLASAEEEVSGKNGIERVLPLLPKIDVAIVGEPTDMQPAIARLMHHTYDFAKANYGGLSARVRGDYRMQGYALFAQVAGGFVASSASATRLSASLMLGITF
jgi:acetylornithine deacetylase